MCVSNFNRFVNVLQFNYFKPMNMCLFFRTFKLYNVEFDDEVHIRIKRHTIIFLFSSKISNHGNLIESRSHYHLNDIFFFQWTINLKQNKNNNSHQNIEIYLHFESTLSCKITKEISNYHLKRSGMICSRTIFVGLSFVLVSFSFYLIINWFSFCCCVSHYSYTSNTIKYRNCVAVTLNSI